MGSSRPTMRKRVFLPFLLCLQVLPSIISSRQKRQLNFESDSTENDQRPTSKVFFGLTNIFGSGFGGLVGSNGDGDTCSCSTGSDLEDRVPAPRVGQLCNCATSVEFGGDCKGRDPGDRFFGCGCGGPGNGIFTFSKRRKRHAADSGNVREETQERIFNLRCVTAFVTGRNVN